MSERPIDLLVLGAGIIGSATAYLARQRHPDWRIEVWDAATPASGASRVSAGFAPCVGRTPRQRQLALRSRALYEEFRHAVALPITPVPVHWIVSEKRREVLTATFADKAPPPLSDDAKRAWAEKAQVRLRDDDLVFPEAAEFADVPGATLALLAAFKATPGSSLEEGNAARAVAAEGNALRVTGVRRSTLAARVVSALGASALDGPGGDAARAAGLRTKKVVAFELTLSGRMPSSTYFYDDESFLLDRPGGVPAILSVTSQQWDCGPRRDLVADEADRALARAVIASRLPNRGAEIVGARVSADAYTESREPLIVAHETLRGLVLATGCSGSGYRLAPGIAEAAMALATQARG